LPDVEEQSTGFYLSAIYIMYAEDIESRKIEENVESTGLS
jgi:hypothetical protein